ncbi:PAS domain S-box protein [Desulfocurvus sp. DL9XJH121]
MTILGRLSVYDCDSFYEVRKKLLHAVALLGFDSLHGTTLVAAFSELCRVVRGEGEAIRTYLAIKTRDAHPALCMAIRYRHVVSPPRAAARFFDSFAVKNTPLGTTVMARRRLPSVDSYPRGERLDALNSILARPSQNQLIQNIQNKNAELAESEARIKTVLEGAPDPLIIVDHHGRITYLNAQAEKTFGYSRRELLGMRTRRLVPEEIRNIHPGHVRSFFQRPVDEMFAQLSDAEAVVKGGGRISVDIKLSPIQTPGGLQVIASVRDVTAQKKAQEVIKKLSKVVDQSPVIVVITNREGIIEYVNPAFSSVTGYLPEDVLGHNPRMLQSGKTPPEVYENLWATILDGRPWKGVFHNRKKNGEEYWESASIAPIIDKEGGITHFVAVKEDVTERMRMEETVRESEVKYRELVENASSIILKMDCEGNVTFFNEYAQEFFGYEEEEILGHNIVGTIVPRLETTGRDLGRLIAKLTRDPDQFRQIENENMCKDGTRVWVSWTNRALVDEDTGDVLGLLCVGLDITAQMHAQQERDKASRALDERNKELAELSNKLSKYLSPQVYASIFSGDWDVELKTTRKKLTVFFSDIKDFTTTTDDMQPEDLTELLNSYFTEMARIALEHGATIDKFIGDAMLMFFGDPETKGVEEDAKCCVRMAIAMQKRMVELSNQWRSLGYEKPFRMRVGINTGYCNVGNFGSADRMDYTIIGGAVNLAARLEALADPGGILMSYETYALVNDIVEAEERPPITAKGIRRKVRPYAVVAEYGDIDEASRFICSQSEGLRIQMDMDKLDSAHRAQAIDALQKAIVRLSSSR